MLTLPGNVAALLSPIVFVPILTFVFGRQNYDWQSMKNIRRGDDTEIVRHSSVTTQAIDPEIVPGSEQRTQADEDAEVAHLTKAAKIARSLTVFMTLALLVLWPMPMYGSKYVFSKKFFTGTLSKPIDQNLANMSQVGWLSESYGFSSARSVLVFSRSGKAERQQRILSSRCSWI